MKTSPVGAAAGAALYAYSTLYGANGKGCARDRGAAAHSIPARSPALMLYALTYNP